MKTSYLVGGLSVLLIACSQQHSSRTIADNEPVIVVSYEKCSTAKVSTFKEALKKQKIVFQAGKDNTALEARMKDKSFVLELVKSSFTENYSITDLQAIDSIIVETGDCK